MRYDEPTRRRVWTKPEPTTCHRDHSELRRVVSHGNVRIRKALKAHHAAALEQPRFWGGGCLLLQYLLQSCSRGGRGIVIGEDMCYERQRAKVCVD
jgi:hypothetical protein